MKNVRTAGEVPLHAVGHSEYRPESSRSSTIHASDSDNGSLFKGHPIAPKTAARTFWNTLGLFSSAVLIGTTATLLISIGFISFIWIFNDRNVIWKRLASEDRITKAVTISSLVLRTSIALQAGLGTSMLAGLALERSQVLLSQLASISTIRNSNSGPYSLAWLLFSPTSLKARGRNGCCLSAAIGTLALITVLSQLTSTVLLSDVSLGVVSGFVKLDNLATTLAGGSQSLLYTTFATSAWLRRPSFYAGFAEYMSPFAVSTGGSGFSTTGLSLRALLPVPDQQDRTLIKEYNGMATVIDTSVVCFAPVITGFQIFTDTGDAQITGNVSIPTETIAAYNKEYGGSLVDYSSEFELGPSTINRTEFICLADITGIMTLCQMGPHMTGSFLVGQLQPFPRNTSQRWVPGYDSQNQYLVMKTNITGSGFGLGKAYHTHNSTEGEWLRAFFQTGDGNNDTTLQMDISLCYNSLDSLDTQIVATTNRSRSEASPEIGNNSYNFTNVLGQFGLHGGSPNERGLLELTHFRQGVLPTADFPPPTNSSSYIKSTAQQIAPISVDVAQGSKSASTVELQFSKLNGGPVFVDLTAYSAHSDLVNFVNQTMIEGGGIAFAMQSLITILAGSMYYEQLPNFDDKTPVKRSNFAQAQIPAGKGLQYSSDAAGSQRGFVAVLVMTIIHVMLMAGIIIWFYTGTRISTLGNAWQTIAQIQDPAIEKYISSAALASDSEVEQWMRHDGNGDKIVGMRWTAWIERGGTTEVIERAVFEKARENEASERRERQDRRRRSIDFSRPVVGAAWG